MMNLGNNIELDILKSVFLFKRGIFVSRDSLYQLGFLREEKSENEPPRWHVMGIC